MKISVSKINFGDVLVNETIIKNFNIINETNADISVLLTSSNTSYIISPNVINIKANKTAAILVKFKPVDELQYNATISLSDGLNLLSVQCFGSGIKPKIGTIDNVNFNNTSINLSKTETFLIKNTGDKGILNVTLSSSNNLFVLSKTSVSIKPLSEEQISINFKSNITGFNSSSIIINSNSSNLPLININAIANVIVPQITSNRSDINFGNIPINDKKTEIIQLTNLSSVDLNITNITVNSGFILKSQTSYLLHQNEVANVEIEFEPKDSMLINGSLIISSNDIKHSNFEIPLSGKGVYEPNIKVDSNNVLFGDVYAFLKTTKTFRVHNKGTVSLNIDINSGSNSNFIIDQREDRMSIISKNRIERQNCWSSNNTIIGISNYFKNGRFSSKCTSCTSATRASRSTRTTRSPTQFTIILPYTITKICKNVVC